MSNTFEFPMSCGQQRIWMLEQFKDNNQLYNLSLGFKIKGAIDVGVLNDSIIDITKRYEILRTNFKMQNDKPVQIVYEEDRVVLQYIEFLNTSESAINKLIHNESNYDFNLQKDPLLRVNLIKIQEGEYILLFVIHHIISDSWSLRILIKEVLRVYESKLEDLTYKSPELRLQYADYSVWQSEWLKSEHYKDELAYWKKQLEDTSQLINLPTDKPRPATQSFEGNTVHFEIPDELQKAVIELNRKNNTTMFMTMLAAFSLLLRQASGQDVVIIGTPVMNRSRKELEDQIGFFVNSLPIKSVSRRETSFSQFLRETREVVLSAFSNKEIPFEKLVEEINPRRDLSYTPLFQVFFSMHDEKMLSIETKNLQISLLDVKHKNAKFDLTLFLEETLNGIKGGFEYNTDLFEQKTIERFVNRYITILSRAIEDTEQSIDAIISIPAEEVTLIKSWNKTSVELPINDTVISQFETQVNKTPHSTALIFNNISCSFHELQKRSRVLASELIEQGVTSGDIIGIYIDRSIEMVVGILAILKAGAAYLPLDPILPTERITYMLDNAVVTKIVAIKKYNSELVEYNRKIIFIEEVIKNGESTVDDCSVSIIPEQVAYIMYTSGSSGQPKGVEVEHRQVINFFVGMDEKIGKDIGTFLALTPYTFDISILELLWSLTRGFKVVIYPGLRESGNNRVLNKKKMDFSLFYFASSDNEREKDKYRLLIDGARFADENGFTAVWTPERHFHEFGGLYPNPAVTAAALAACTTRIGIRAGSVVIPLHHPLRVAEEWSVVDNLSGGRVAIACASGWHANDFVFAPENYNKRQEAMYDSLKIVRSLWRGNNVKYKDGNGLDKDIKIFPKPVQKELPIWITSGGNLESFKTAGRKGYNILTHLLGESVEELAVKIAAYRQELSDNGYNPDSRKVSIMLHTFLGNDLSIVHETVRKPFINYLRSSLGLVKNMAANWGINGDLSDFSEDDIEALLQHGFNRYVGTSGLIGTPDVCKSMLEKLNQAGVNEVACLIDFGPNYKETMKSLELLNELKNIYNRDSSDNEQLTLSIPEQIIRQQVTHIQCTPSMFSLFTENLNNHNDAFGSVKKILLGGEKLPLSLAGFINERLEDVELWNMYGPTETTIWSTVYKVEKGVKKVFIGKPIANTTIYILDKDLRLLPIGSCGEIFIGGKGISRGYINAAELTLEKFIENPFGEGRLYKTGDLGRYNNDGEIEYLGRNDNQVKIRGHRIELGEIEAVLNGCELVKNAVVYLEEKNNKEAEIVAYMTLQNKDLSPSYSGNGSGRDLFRLPNGMKIDHYDATTSSTLFKEIFVDNIYIRHNVFLQEGACVIDAGANIGVFSLFIHSQFSDICVYAFEPIAPTYERLRNNFNNYSVQGKVYNVGLSNKDEIVEFTHYPRMSGVSGRFSEQKNDISTAKALLNNYLYKEDVAASHEIDAMIKARYEQEKHTCKVTTLSAMIAENDLERIDLLKIDVEKSELLVLQGIADEDWPKIRQIVMEVDTLEHKEQIVELLVEKGYDVIVDDLINLEKMQVYMLYATKADDQQDKHKHIVKAYNPNASARIRQVLKDKLPEYMIPSRLHVLDAFPINANGKIDHIAVKNIKIESGRVMERLYDPTNQSLMEIVSGIWSEVLDVKNFHQNDNFFDLGGHSLSLLKVQARINEVLHQNISIIEFFKYPTIYSLVEYLNQHQKNSFSENRGSIRKERMLHNSHKRKNNR